jgi:Zn-dependent alcohol dehydrogenase
VAIQGIAVDQHHGLARAVVLVVQLDRGRILFADSDVRHRIAPGAVYGGSNPAADIPKLLRLYKSGQLKLDEMVTRTYSLDEINDGYVDTLSGSILRGLITFD